ncbi:DUF4291 family protein [Rapidithrix thailandica]|uniref:DUF4291 family protein n=1 Tax=Rapidithrix thailandica TaxID=413964 RepID=A0AAW9S981_9BACT
MESTGESVSKLIYADYDEEGVYVYQAFKPQTVQTAVALGTFGKGFGLDRISWIKPSFGWVLRRTKYGTKNRMQGIAKIKLSHQAFHEIISQSIESHWNQNVFASEDVWRNRLNSSDVIHQWDPERDLIGRRLERQAIQIGIRGEVIKKYVSDYIIGVEDVSSLAHEISRIKKGGATNFPGVPEEKEYPISEELFFRLGCVR